ncbi:MAG TPA: hypothetical protein VFW71_14235 [Actinomycetota bacterium]|nr:hypothetical protein [Actinomycetota bacterium]
MAVILADALGAAEAGPLLTAELLPLNNKGKLRVTYNWLYSALNCDPGDATRFSWTLTKLDQTQVSLSPTDQYRGMTLFASVRDDWDWFVQVQAPRSADWIKAVGGDERITLVGDDLLIVGLQGFNNQAIAVDAALSVHDNHSGYRLRSVGSADPKSRLFFVGVTQVLQVGLRIPTLAQLTPENLREILGPHGLGDDPDVLKGIAALQG